MVGGTLPAGPVNEKMSVRHWVARLTGLPLAVKAVLPPTSQPLERVTVDGPVMTKLLKSTLIWKKTITVSIYKEKTIKLFMFLCLFGLK